MSSRRPRAASIRLRDFPKLVAARREAEYRRQLAARPDLTYLFWECTLRCNLACAHCGSSCEAKTPLEELDTAQVKRALDTIAEDFDASRIFVSITGGEPLVRKDLFEVVAHMTRLGMRSCIVTNGTLLDAERAARLYDAGMRTVSISIDGLEAEHEKIRGPRTFERTLAAFGHARRAGLRTVEAITCVRPANFGQLDAIERRVREAGANLWRLITIDCMGRLSGEKHEQMWLEPAQVNALVDYISRRRASASRDGQLDTRFSCGGFLGLHAEGLVRPRGGQCYAGLCIASILADGQVGACPSIPRQWAAQGSVLHTRFSTIWRERFEKYRDFSSRRDGPCRDCSWFDTCLGGGLHERLVQPDNFCWLERQDGRAP